MKKFLAALLFLPVVLFADTKISDLTNASSMSGTDIIPIVINPGSVPANRKITKNNFLLSIDSTTVSKSMTVSGETAGTTPILKVLNSSFDNTFTNDTPSLLVQGDFDSSLLTNPGPILRIDNDASGGGTASSVVSFSKDNADKTLISWMESSGGDDSSGQMCMKTGNNSRLGMCFGAGATVSGHNKTHVVIGGNVSSGGPNLDIIADTLQNAPTLKIRADTLGSNQTEWWNNGATVMVSSVGPTGIFTGADFNAKYGVRASSISVVGSGAGQITLVEGSSATIQDVGTGVTVLWADNLTHKLMFNANNVSTQTVMGNPATSGETWVNNTGGLYISSTFTVVNASTSTWQNVYFDLTSAHLGLPERTAAQIAAAVPKTNGWGNIVKCTDCAATVNVCTSTGTGRGAWALITATGSACQ